MSVAPILILGNANVDLVLGEVDGWPAVGTEIMVERSEMRPGGSAGNTALALTGMGVDHRFIASTGNDPNGAWLRSCFDARCCDWIVDVCDTTITVGIVHKGGDRAFFTTPGHLQRARVEDLIGRLPDAPRSAACALISGSFLMPSIEAGTAGLLDRLTSKGWRTAIDPGWPPSGWTEAATALMREWLGRADIALLNEEEVGAIAGQAGNLLRDDQVLVVKRGAAGASAFAAGESFDVAAPCVCVIDTVGAGDTFNAGFLAAMVEGLPLKEALLRGVLAASRAISTFPRQYG